MEEQEKAHSSTLSESIDIKVEEFSDCGEDYAEHESNSNEQQDIVQVNVKCENDNFPLSRAKQSNESNLDYKWTCSQCTKTGTGVKKFKHHLSNAHYRDELMALWPGGRAEPCPYCHKCLFSDSSRSAPSRTSWIILNHLGSAHNLVLQYLDDTLKSELQSKVIPRSLGLAKVLDEARFDCLLCPSSFKSLRNMKQHMAWVHFKETILQESGSANGKCGRCEFNFTGKQSRTKDMLNHLINKHCYLYKVVPEDIAQKLLQLDDSGSEKREFDMSRGLMLEGQYKCPYCKMPIKTYESVLKHVIQQHLLKDILMTSGCVDTDSCKICGRMFTTSSKETFKQKLACHLAHMHGYLEKSLTEEAKNEMAKLKETHRKNGDSRKRLKNIKIKPRKPKERKKRVLHKPCQKIIEPQTIPDNLKERLVAFEDARTNGVLKSEAHVGVTPGYESRTKIFFGGDQKPPDYWQCFLCLHTGNNIHQLKTHLATRHFRNLLMFFWPDDSFDHPCPYCHKPVIKKPTLQDGVKEYCAINHLARHHELIKQVTSGDVKNALEEFEKAQFLLNCPLCPEVFKTMASLESHLILEHYRDEVMNASGSSGAVCGICNEQFSDKRSMSVHAARQHDLVRKVFAKEVLDYLEMFDFDKTFAKEKVVEFVEQEDIHVNFVDMDSVEFEAEEEKAEPAKDSLEIDIDKLTRKKKRRIKNEDECLLKQELSEIIITDSSIGSFSS